MILPFTRSTSAVEEVVESVLLLVVEVPAY